MKATVRIGTRESQLAIWQAAEVKRLLASHQIISEFVYIKSEGDMNLTTPIYQMGVQGVFTKALDIALLNNEIDIAVHSMKDVPIQLAAGIVQAAVLKRASYKDILVYNGTREAVTEILDNENMQPLPMFTIATSSVRRKAQWLHRYPHHTIENLRGNVNTRLKKLKENNWNGAIFAAAGLERIFLRPHNTIELDWMLPAPAQGAIMVVCREADMELRKACSLFNDATTALCVQAERDFLKTLMGGCSTPISALAQIKNGSIEFKGNIFSLDGKEKVEVEKLMDIHAANTIGAVAANEILNNGGRAIADQIQHAAK